MKTCLAFLIAFLPFVTSLRAAPAARLKRPIDSEDKIVFKGHLRVLPRTALDLGEANGALPLPRLKLHFAMSPSQAADLNTLLKSQQDRHGSSYRKWLTPEQFGERFGANQNDFAKIKDWLESAGFTNVELSRSRTFVSMSSTVALANASFGVAIHQYGRGGERFLANTAEPMLPKALQGVVTGLAGLTNRKLRPTISRTNPAISIGINGNHFLGPTDLATIYDLQSAYGAGTDGTGQTIAVVGQSNIALSDIAAFQKLAGLPVKYPQVVLAGDTDPGVSSDDASEADLDLEWSGAVARGATLIYVNSPSAIDSAVYAIENNLATVVSISYSICEPGLSPVEVGDYNTAFQMANAEGITVVASSGDVGAAACDVDQDPANLPESVATFGLAVNFPASSPYVTAVGGTEFDEAQGNFWNSAGNALSYIPEIAWNDTSSFKALSASGGGASQLFTKPDWQTGTSVPNDGRRDLPDLALSASPVHDPYLICSAGSCSNGLAPTLNQIYFVGGTSCGAPVFSGMLALLNQSSNGSQGNINPALYTLASFGSGVFHDVELGDNKVPCVSGSPDCAATGTMGFSAGPGYDEVTGLGSLDAGQLIAQWGSDFDLAPNPTSISMAAGETANVNVQVNRFANFAGQVSFACAVAGTLSNTTCSISGPITGSGTVALSITNTSPASAGARFRFINPPPSSSFLIYSGALGLLVALAGKRRLALSAACATLCLLAAVSCGSGTSSAGSPVTQTLTGNISVVATCGVLQHSVNIPVTISGS